MRRENEDRKRIRNSLIGKREKVVSAKVSIALDEAVRRIVEGNRRYQTINDFVEEAVIDKVMEIRIIEEKKEGC